MLGSIWVNPWHDAHQINLPNKVVNLIPFPGTLDQEQGQQGNISSRKWLQTSQSA